MYGHGLSCCSEPPSLPAASHSLPGPSAHLADQLHDSISTEATEAPNRRSEEGPGLPEPLLAPLCSELPYASPALAVPNPYRLASIGLAGSIGGSSCAARLALTASRFSGTSRASSTLTLP